MGKPHTPPPPDVLGDAGSSYWKTLHGIFVIQDQDAPLVLSLCVLVDRLAAIRAKIGEQGLCTKDRFGIIGPNKLLEHERSTALAAGRMWRELGFGSVDDTSPHKISLGRAYR